jgi:hypothetical protein
MSKVGLVSIAVGVLSVCNRGLLLVAPGATLRWIKRMIETSSRIRVLGAVVLILGATMVWAGASEDSVLATVLSVFGWAMVAMGTLVMMLFPGVYRAMANAVLPSDPSGSLLLWRFRGLAGVIAGVLLMYYGVLAL